MFSARNCFHFGLVLAVFAVFIPRSAAQTISCSSDDGKRHYCAANANGRIRLSRQRSESACREGYSWGSDDRGVWVDHGCRAEFTVDERGGGWFGGRDRDRDRDHDRDRDRDGDNDRYRGNDGYGGGNSGAGQVVSCSSDDMHRHYCPVDTRGGVQMVKQHSESSCQQGRGWGYNRRGIWVDHGCRADFQVGGRY